MIHGCKLRCVSVTSRTIKNLDRVTNQVTESLVYDARLTVLDAGIGKEHFSASQAAEVVLLGLENLMIHVNDVCLMDLSLPGATDSHVK